MNAIPATPKRRWFRFRLRSLFILVTLCCLAMGWYAVRVLPQKRAVAEIRAEGGNCLYNFDFPGANEGPFDRYGKFHWLPDLFGEDLFYLVTKVRLRPSSDATLAQIGNLTSLRELYLQQGSFTDEGLRNFSRLGQLRRLDIEGVSIAGQAFASLVDLPHFETLHLSHCNELTATGQQYIGQLEHLIDFAVVDCDSLTADCLRPIVARGKLVRLVVEDCPQVDFTKLDLTPLRPQCGIQIRPLSTAPATVDPDAGDQP